MKHKQTCQMPVGDELCGQPAIVRVMDHDEHGEPRSRYMCAEHFDQVQPHAEKASDVWMIRKDV